MGAAFWLRSDCVLPALSLRRTQLRSHLRSADNLRSSCVLRSICVLVAFCGQSAFWLRSAFCPAFCFGLRSAEHSCVLSYVPFRNLRSKMLKTTEHRVLVHLSFLS